MDSSRVRIYFDELKRNEINSVWEHNNKRKKQQLEIRRMFFFPKINENFLIRFFFVKSNNEFLSLLAIISLFFLNLHY